MTPEEITAELFAGYDDDCFVECESDRCVKCEREDDVVYINDTRICTACLDAALCDVSLLTGLDVDYIIRRLED
jgi:hypothetical protein